MAKLRLENGKEVRFFFKFEKAALKNNRSRTTEPWNCFPPSAGRLPTEATTVPTGEESSRKISKAHDAHTVIL